VIVQLSVMTPEKMVVVGALLYFQEAARGVVIHDLLHVVIVFEFKGRVQSRQCQQDAGSGPFRLECAVRELGEQVQDSLYLCPV